MAFRGLLLHLLLLLQRDALDVRVPRLREGCGAQRHLGAIEAERGLRVMQGERDLQVEPRNSFSYLYCIY